MKFKSESTHCSDLSSILPFEAWEELLYKSDEPALVTHVS